MVLFAHHTKWTGRWSILENGEFVIINDKKLFHNAAPLVPTANKDDGADIHAGVRADIRANVHTTSPNGSVKATCNTHSNARDW